MNKSGIELHNLAIGYDKSPVITGMNLTLPLGKTLALVGGNGSGKSTLLKTLAGLLPPLAGTLEVLGAKPGKQPLKISYHGQFHPNTFLLPLRSIDVVRMARFPHRGYFGRITQEDENLIQNSLAQMDALELAEKPINSLSGGQKQRVFLAHTLAREADLVLLDEPTAGLDVPGSELYGKMIQELKNQGKTLIIATHSIKEAAQCDFVLLLASRVVDFGTPAQVMTSVNLMETFGLVAQLSGNDILIVDPHHGHDHP